MGCLKLQEEKENKGTLVYMKGKSKQNKEKQKNSNGDNGAYYIPESTIKVLKWTAGICATMITIVLGVVGWMATQLYDMKEKSLTNDSVAIVTIKKDINGVKDDINEINDGLNGACGVYARLAAIENEVDIPTIIASTDTQSFIDDISIQKNEISTSTSAFEAKTNIGTDSNGVDYIAEEWVGKTVLISYQEDGKEVYFLGQYNENYHWDGYCVTNAYNADGTLYGICESNFDDGKRLDYVSLYYSGDNEWIYANRELINDENVGVTVNYYIEDNKVKNFTTTNVRVTDILYADAYIGNIDKHITKYYTGNTVNNVFSDSTGNAYEVKYDTDGTVKLLYVGRFKDGYFNDETGEAFSIVYADEYNAYFCNTGKFTNGNAEKHSDEPITIDEIKEIIKDYSFDCELKWKQAS